MGPKFELRAFFPIGNLACNYSRALEKLVKGRVPLEDRTDAYYVTPGYFGLKQRDGEKLELKVRSKDCIEQWEKFELTSDEPQKCVDQICEILTKSKYPTNPNDLDFSRSVTFTKSVSKTDFDDDNVAFEITKITIEDLESEPQEWWTTCVEGKKDKAVHKFASNSSHTANMRDVIRAAHVGGFSAVMAGYPMFTHRLAGSVSPKDQKELDDSWKGLVKLVGNKGD